jgi:hypothetical protein
LIISPPPLRFSAKTCRKGGVWGAWYTVYHNVFSKFNMPGPSRLMSRSTYVHGHFKSILRPPLAICTKVRMYRIRRAHGCSSKAMCQKVSTSTPASCHLHRPHGSASLRRARAQRSNKINKAGKASKCFEDIDECDKIYFLNLE